MKPTSFLHRVLFGPPKTETEPIVLSQRRVYVMPTALGLLYGIGLLLMLIGSINYNLSLGFMLTFLLAGVGLVTMLHTFRNLAWLSLRAHHAQPVFAGEEALFVLAIDNPARHERHSVMVWPGEPPALDARSGTDLPAGGSVELALPVNAPRRGWQPCGRFTLETRYPLGLFRAWAHVRPDRQVLVYPRPRQRPLPEDINGPEGAQGPVVSAGTDDFAGLRAFQPGDSPRHVAWKSASHLDTLLTKQWSGSRSIDRWLSWDALPGDLPVDSRLEFLAGWVMTLAASGQRHGLRLPGTTIEPDGGIAHRNACLRALALFPGAQSVRSDEAHHAH